MRALLERYIRMLVEAVTDDENEETIDEFSGAGAVAGYTLPLGTSKDDFAVPAPRRAKKRRTA